MSTRKIIWRHKGLNEKSVRRYMQRLQEDVIKAERNASRLARSFYG